MWNLLTFEATLDLIENLTFIYGIDILAGSTIDIYSFGHFFDIYGTEDGHLQQQQQTKNGVENERSPNCLIESTFTHLALTAVGKHAPVIRYVCFRA